MILVVDDDHAVLHSLELLLKQGAQISYSDPYVPRFRVGRDVFFPEECWLQSVQLTEEVLSTTDCVVIVAGHRAVNYAQVIRHASVVVDAVNATHGLGGPAHVIRVGAPAH